MQETIKTGTILVKDGTQFPGAAPIESASYSPGWRSVTGLDGYAIDKKMHDAGWTFFYLAGENTATVFGSECQETVRRAIEQILARLKTKNFNCLEVTRILFKHFLGVNYATVSFHMRNVQEGMFLLNGDNVHPLSDTRLVAA